MVPWQCSISLYSHLSYKLTNKTWFKVQKYKRIYAYNCVVVSFLFNDTQENIPHRIITHQIFCPNNMFSLLIWGKCIYMRIACFFVLLCCNAIMINENLSDRWNSPSTHTTLLLKPLLTALDQSRITKRPPHPWCPKIFWTIYSKIFFFLGKIFLVSQICTLIVSKTWSN